MVAFRLGSDYLNLFLVKRNTGEEKDKFQFLSPTVQKPEYQRHSRWPNFHWKSTEVRGPCFRPWKLFFFLNLTGGRWPCKIKFVISFPCLVCSCDGVVFVCVFFANGGWRDGKSSVLLLLYFKIVNFISSVVFKDIKWLTIFGKFRQYPIRTLFIGKKITVARFILKIDPCESSFVKRPVTFQCSSPTSL